MRARGFSLIEVLVALSLLGCAVGALSQLIVASAQATADARRLALASVLASQKMEELRAVGSDLSPESTGSLRRNVDGRCDFLDEYGRGLGGGTRPPEGTTFIRRWAIEALPSDPSSTFLLRVAVMPRTWRGSSPASSADPRAFGGAEIVTIHTRRAW